MDDTSNINRVVRFDKEAKLASSDESSLEMENSNSELGLLEKPKDTSQKMSEEHVSVPVSIKRCLSTSGKLLGSLFARVLFLSHSVVCMFMAISSIDIPYIYVITAPISLLVIESYITLRVRKNVEWKWFSPCIAIYQLCTVPSIWMMEYQQHFGFQHAVATNSISDLMMTTTSSSSDRDVSMNYLVTNAINSTVSNVTDLSHAMVTAQVLNSSELTSTILDDNSALLNENNITTELWQNVSAVISYAATVVANTTTNTMERLSTSSTGNNSVVSMRTSDGHAEGLPHNSSYAALSVGVQDSHHCPGDAGIANFKLTTGDSLANYIKQYCRCNRCVPLMEQMLLLIMIIGRWLLPRGDHLTRGQKAQLLLVNIAIAADILELFEMMKEEKVADDKVLITIVLTLWSCSLTQFSISATATAKKACRGCSCFESEIWALVTLMLLDDAPFLTFRLVCIFKYKVISYNSYFFAAKNLLVLALDVNRMIALSKENAKLEKQEAQATELEHFTPRRSISRIRR